MQGKQLINLTTKISYKEYRQLVLQLTWQRLPTKSMAAIGAFFILMAILALLTAMASSDFSQVNSVIVNLVLGLILGLLLPLAALVSAKQSYATNKMMHEELYYEIDEEAVKIHGETFNNEVMWKSLWKIVELKDWIVLYQSKTLANFIPKRAISAENLSVIKNIFDLYPEVKKKLRKGK